MRRTPALVRLEKKLAKDPCAILGTTEIRVLDREVRRALVSSFPGIEARLAHSEDSTRCCHVGQGRSQRTNEVACSWSKRD
jgi:hypothetical protein